MPKLKPGTIVPTPEEAARITAAAMSDPDAKPLTDDEWEAVKPLTRIGRPPFRQAAEGADNHPL